MPRKPINTSLTSRAGNHRKIIILDLLSEMNRGDAAIQVGMLKILRQSYPGATFTVVSAIGANQYPDLLEEFDHSLQNGQSIHGGLIPTYYPLKKKAGNAPLFEIKNALGIISRLWILAALKIKIPALFVKHFLSRKYQLVMDRILEADLVVIKGRNYRQRKSEGLEIFRVITKIFTIWLCALLKKRIFLIGVSVWEQRSELANRMLANAFKSCELVTVRERSSLKVVQKWQPGMISTRPY
jgi:polysaccharide pyruvyl transferase WcaK-like protein